MLTVFSFQRAETGLDYEGSDWVYALTANFNVCTESTEPNFVYAADTFFSKAFAQTIIPVFQEIFKINMVSGLLQFFWRYLYLLRVLHF